MIRLTLTNFYANCLKSSPTNSLNERTPFVEYVVPIFKYYSAVYNDLTFQWCEKGLETNKCIFESSGEENDGHTQDVTIKLLECSIRSLKMEMENIKDASFEYYKKRRFFTYLYAGDKLTMLSTSVVSREKWGYTLVREAIVPRTWNARVRWLKVMDLIFYTKVEFVLIAMLEEQKEVATILESEHNGWTQVAQGTTIKHLSKLP
ncbi:hypothetical protein G6F61_000128 [Rhizopus arrhizus]|nr:hypothetical protein G6F61_000128 [Rhizopus arrhizus]